MWIEVVRKWLFEGDLSQAQLARRARISAGHLNQCLKDHRSPGPNTFRKLERAMSLEPGSLSESVAKEQAAQ